MNKNTIIALIVAGVIAIGGLAYYFTKDTADTGSNNKDSTLQTDGSPAFPERLFTYPVTMNGSTNNPSTPEQNGTFIVRMQDENTWEMELTTPGGEAKFIYTADSTYIQNPEDGSWIKSPTTGTSPLDQVGFDDEEIQDYKNNATYQGKQDCPAGTCDVWAWTDPEDNDNTATVKVDSSGRISKVTSINEETTVTFTYDYDSSVNITIPENTQDISIPQ